MAPLLGARTRLRQALVGRHQPSPAEVARFRREGFVVIDRAVVVAGAIAEVRTTLDALFDRSRELPQKWVHDLAPATESGSVPEIVNCAHLEPRLLQSTAYRSARGVARRLVGSPVHLAFDHAIFKLPGSAASTALHQDLAFAPDRDVPTATIWLALVDATEANGCMRFAPKTPAGLLPHEPVGRDALGAVGVDLADAPPCPVPAGGFTVHSQRALHGTGGNRTDQVRVAWILKFEKDDRVWRRRAWDRLLEFRGVVTPRRFREVCAAFAEGARGARQDPDWVGTPRSDPR